MSPICPNPWITVSFRAWVIMMCGWRLINLKKYASVVEKTDNIGICACKEELAWEIPAPLLQFIYEYKDALKYNLKNAFGKSNRLFEATLFLGLLYSNMLKVPAPLLRLKYTLYIPNSCILASSLKTTNLPFSFICTHPPNSHWYTRHGYTRINLANLTHLQSSTG